MSQVRRRRVVAIVALAVVVGLGVVVVPRTGWFGPRARFTATELPSCAAILSAPRVEDAVRTAFADTWEQHYSGVGPGPAMMCNVTALPKAVLPKDFPPNGTPWSRSLFLGFLVSNEYWNSADRPLYRLGGVREARGRFVEIVRTTCGSENEERTAEPDLGDEAVSCWKSGSAMPRRVVVLRISNLVINLTYDGADFYSPVRQDDSASEEDLADNARCIAEEIAGFFGAPVREPHRCGRPALNV